MNGDGTYEFEMDVVDKDPSGYYYVRWDRATPLTVRAANRDAAFRQAWIVMGEAPRYRIWTARIKSIKQVAE